MEPLGSNDLLGVELEFTYPERYSLTTLFEEYPKEAELSGEVYNTSKIFSLSYEESLDPRPGIEIKTVPVEAQIFLDNPKVFSGLMCDYFRKKNCASYFSPASCGLHVHLDLNSFLNDRALERFIGLVLDPQHRFFTKLLSQRKPQNLENWSSFFDTEHVSAKSLSKRKTTPWRGAVSMEGRDTVEVRLFRGTLHAPSF